MLQNIISSHTGRNNVINPLFYLYSIPKGFIELKNDIINKFIKGYRIKL
jgi:hypothetical protein